jgi:DNA mismatch repair protein MutS
LTRKHSTKKSNNYIAAIVFSGNHSALATADISTGLFQVQEFETENIYHTIANEFAKINPAECILSETLYKDYELLKTIRSVPNCNVYVFPQWETYESEGERYLMKHFNIKSVEVFNLERNSQAVTVATALLAYLRNTQKERIFHFKTITKVTSNEFVSLDKSTILNLELFTTIRAGEKKGALIETLDETATAMGGRMLKNWIRKPLRDKETLQNRYDIVEQLVKKQELLLKIQSELKNVSDIERILSRLSVGSGNARDMVTLKNSLSHVNKVIQEFGRIQTNQSLHLQKSIDENIQKTMTEIENKILDEPAFDIKEGKIIKNGVDTELDNLRKTVTKSREWIVELEKEERTRTGIASLKIRFNKVFGFYIEISKANLSLIPKEYLRKQTLVNGERFITPELKKQEELILTAEERMNAIEYKIFSQILDSILQKIVSLQTAAHTVAEIDCLVNFAHIAIKNNYNRPKLIESGELYVKNGRHPVVEKVIQEQFVPNSVNLDTQTNQLWIITGPNMAGKSVYIRQVAVIVLMAQIGSFIPADEARISLCDRIFVRSGASDVISEGLSTFMVEMVETAQILHNATKNSLIVMDEIGRGTSTYDGISIATAVAEYLVTNPNLQAKTLFATHYHELQTLEEKYPKKIKNFHMAVHEDNGELIFLHTLREGGASHSLGVAVAQLAGIPSEVITSAYTHLKQLEDRSKQQLPQDPKINESSEQMHLVFDTAEDPIITELKALDIHQMTPLQALNKLAEIKNKLKLLAVSKNTFIKAD